MTLVNFTDPPTQRGAGLLRNLRGGERHGETASATPGLSPESATDSRSVFPLTLHHNGRMGGPHILYAESAQIRTEWKNKLEEALGLRKIVQESNKVFEVEYLSRDTFIMPPMSSAGAAGPSWNQDSQLTGRVTCSVPFSELSTILGICHVLIWSQTLLTDGLLSRLGVPKVYGLDLDMIQSVSSNVGFFGFNAE